MEKERAITIKKDDQGNIFEIKTNKGNSYDLETAMEFLDPISLEKIKKNKTS